MHLTWKAVVTLLVALLEGNPAFSAWQITRFVAYEGKAIDPRTGVNYGRQAKTHRVPYPFLTRRSR